jgi:O-antigen/teichoic acid export membrane protein
MNGTTGELPAELTVPSQDGARLAKLGLAAAMVSRLIGRLVGIVLVIVLARQAAPQTVAVYGYLLGTAAMALMLTDLGVASIAGREVAAGRLPADGVLGAAVLPQLASAAVAGVVTVALVLFAGPDSAPPAAVALTVAYVLVGGVNNLWAEVLRGAGRVWLEAALDLGSGIALVVAGSLIIVLGGSATALLVVVLLKEVIVLAIAASAIRPRRRPEARTRMLLGQGLWVAASGTAIVLLWRQGTLVIGGVGSIGALATYVVATRFFDAGVTVAHTAGFGLRPGMSSLASDPPAFRQAARKYLGLVTLLGVAVAVVGVLVAGPLTTIPFGDRWESAVPAVRMVAVAGLPILVTYVALTVLAARRQMAWMCASSVLGSVVGLVVTVLLTLARPDAFSAVLGTTIGASVMAVALLVGLRDLILPSRSPAVVDRVPVAA